MVSEILDDAVNVTAKQTDLTPAQVKHVVESYRAAASSLDFEPQWVALMHVHGSKSAIAQYAAEGTTVTFQVESHKERGEWKEWRYYVFNGKPYEIFSEARAAELAKTATDKCTVESQNVTPLKRDSPPSP